MYKLSGPTLQGLLKAKDADGKSVLAELAGTDRRRIETLAALNQNTLSLAETLRAAFGSPDDTPAALSNLRGLRKRFNDAAKQVGSALSFEVDTSKKSAPSARSAWFSGPDQGALQVAELSDKATHSLDITKLERPQLMDPEKISRKVFVCYGRASSYQKAHELKDALEERFKPASRYSVKFWMDEQLNLAEWHPQIQAQLDACDHGLILLSPALLASAYIRQHEFPTFGIGTEGAGKPFSVVGLRSIDVDNDDLHGIDASQIFWHPHEKKRTYCGCTTSQERTAFVDALYRKLIDTWGALPPTRQVSAPSNPSFDLERWSHCCALDNLKQPIRARAQRSNFQALEKEPSNEGSDALTVLTEWARDRSGPPFCAVLGQYGMGKTTTLKWFTRELLARRATEPDLPLPIYIDLRYGELMPEQPLPTLEALLDDHLARSPHLDVRPRAADLLRQVREHGALIIFDGLDEKLVHLKPDRAREYIRTLWRVLPSSVRTSGQASGKLLISCRSHFFRDLQQQAGFLLGEGREDIKPGRRNADSNAAKEGDYRLFVMLPFTEQQIADYLNGTLGDRAGAAALTTIRKVHNLRELAERPVLLAHLAGHIGDLESAHARGDVINAAAVYERVVADGLPATMASTSSMWSTSGP
jgi:hypothetical protein